MLKGKQDPGQLQALLLAVLSTSGTLAGISLALVGIVNLKARSSNVETIADDLFLFSAIGFLLTCYATFFALRGLGSKRIGLWTGFIDVLFLAALTLLVASGFIVVYTLL